MSDQTLTFPEPDAAKLEPHLPPSSSSATPDREDQRYPFVTLTFATSLDSAVSLAPGTRTALSGLQSKAMTHYLRSRHDAICVGVGTAVADDPGLNCRVRLPQHQQHQPRPIVIDPALRWKFTRESKVLQLARVGQGLAPFILTAEGVAAQPAQQKAILEEVGGKFITLPRKAKTGSQQDEHQHFEWRDILRAVKAEGLHSIMVEGGASVINSLLDPEAADLVDSVILTIAPTWLGQGSVVVSPVRRIGPQGEAIPAARLAATTWIPLGEDVVLCGKIARCR